MASIEFNDKGIRDGIKRLTETLQGKQEAAGGKICRELLRLSSYEVPHDKGMLQSSGGYEQVSQDEWLVGYNKVYAARLHEHPEYRFQKGRKGKYLEDPLKHNLSVFEMFWGQELTI